MPDLYDESDRELYMLICGGETVEIDKSILVKNANDIAVKVTLEPDQNYRKIIQMVNNAI